MASSSERQPNGANLYLDLRNLPTELRNARGRWTWCSASTKRPLCKDGSHRNGQWHDKAEDFETVLAGLERKQNRGLRAGFAFASDRAYSGVDLDHVRNPESGQLVPWAREIVDRLATYTEVSESGDGLHLILRGSKPEGFTTCVSRDQLDHKGGSRAQIEVYDHGRYFLTTGKIIEERSSLGSSSGLIFIFETYFETPPSSLSAGDDLRRGLDLDEIIQHGVEEGGRNNCAAQIAGRHFSRGESEKEVLSLLQEWNQRNSPPLSSAEISKVVGSIHRTHKANRIGVFGVLPDPGDSKNDSGGTEESAENWKEPKPLVPTKSLPEFPIDDAFPPALDSLRDYVQSIAQSYQVPVDAVAMLTVGVASFAVAKTIEVEPQPGWREPLPLWILVLLPSGERKSAVFAQILAPMHRWIEQASEAMRAKIAEHVNRVEIIKAKLKKSQQKASSGKEEANSAEDQASALSIELAELEESTPHAPSFVVSDATTEALAQVLTHNQERALVASPEGDALDVLLGRYSDGSANFGVWLSGHAGDAVQVRRRTRDSDRLRRPALAVALAVQPEAVSSLFAHSQARGRGLLARFLPCTPQSHVGYRVLQPTPPDPILRKWWEEIISGLLDVGVPEEPRIVRLASDAAKLFLEFRERIEADLRLEGALGNQRDWGSKLPGAIARIAGILHGLQSRGNEIDLNTMRAALSWVDYLVAHERHVAGHAGEDPTIRVAEKILRWLTRTGDQSFTRRDAFTNNRGTGVQRVYDVDPALELLHELGWIRELPPPPTSGPGRRPSPAFSVHPRLAECALCAESPRLPHSAQSAHSELPVADDDS